MDEISDTMIIMNKGKILEFGNKHSLLEKYKESGSIEYLFFKIIDGRATL